MTSHQSYITDYSARDVARLAYTNWLSRHGANEKVKDGTPGVLKEPNAQAARGKSGLAARIRDSI